MAKKGCGLLLFLSVVIFCAGAAFILVGFISYVVAWIYVDNTSAYLPPEIMLVYLPQFAAFIGAIIGIFWARAMLKTDAE